MSTIIMASHHREKHNAFEQALGNLAKTEVAWVSDQAGLMETIRRDPPQLIILEQDFEGMQDFELARTIVLTNALVNLAVIGDLTEDQFHEKTEGLGILMQLPSQPGVSEAQALWQRFSEVKGGM